MPNIRLIVAYYEHINVILCDSRNVYAILNHVIENLANNKIEQFSNWVIECGAL